MKDKFVYYGYVGIQDNIFTEDRLYEWKEHIKNSYKAIYKSLKEKIDNSCPIRFYVNPSLLDEVIIDAVIGMKKITDSSFNSVENPNAFKIAAYISYWWLRHKPVCIHYSKNFSLQDLVIVSDEEDPEKLEDERQQLIWKLKHVNELVAVQMVFTYIFDLDKTVCGNRQCKKVKSKEGDNFYFESYDDMLEVFLRKLTYYFSYRAIAPKMIEHLLEAYTFHPAWGLTGPQWSLKSIDLDNLEEDKL